MSTATQTAIATGGTTPLPARRFAAITLAMWVAMLAVDLLLNGGLFSPVFLRPSPFLLTPEQLLRRIPFGYLDFLLLAILLLWLMARLGTRGAQAGWRLGLTAGALTGAAFLLGLYSVATAEVLMLVVWFVAGTVQLGVAGAVAGAALAGKRPGRLLGLSFALLVAAVILTAIMQTTGVATAIKK